MKNTSLIVSAVLWLCGCLSVMAAGNKVYVVQSPDKQLKVEISAGTDGLIYSVYHKDSLIVVDSKLGLIQEGKTPALAGVAKVISAKTKKIFQDIDAPFYRFKSFQAVCNEMNLKLEVKRQRKILQRLKIQKRRLIRKITGPLIMKLHQSRKKSQSRMTSRNRKLL